jgi:hypothetical protein
MGSFNKNIFHQYVESECDRRLMWLLGAEDAAWLQTPRAAKVSSRPRSGADLGKDYERKVYEVLRQMPGAVAHMAPSGLLTSVHMDGARLMAQVEQVASAGGYKLLLEHQWPLTEGFVRHVFNLDPTSPLPVSDIDDKGMRPDLLVLERSAPHTGELEVRPGGVLRALAPQEGRVRLSVIDIKHTSEQSVGKKHFVELLVYAHALAHWIEDQGLNDRCYVSTHGHGIFPFVDLSGNALRERTLEAVRVQVVPMVWRDVHILFERTCERIRALDAARPLAIEQVQTRIGPVCGYCPFLADCKHTLSRGGSQDVGSWDVRLLPYTSATLAELLRARGYTTLRDVAERLTLAEFGETPDPLYAEAPQLILKARALIAGQNLPANALNLDGQRLFSIATPRYTNLRMFFDAETDTVQQRVFAFGLRLEAGAPASARFAPQLDAWLAAWREVLETPNITEADVLRRVRATIHPDLLAMHQRGELTVGPGADKGAEDQEVESVLGNIDEVIRQVWRGFKTLESTAGKLQWMDASEQGTRRFRYEFTYVSPDKEHEDEAELVAQLITQLFALVAICHGTEALTGVPEVFTGHGIDKKTAQSKKGKHVHVHAPEFAAFYWSAEQLEQIEDLMERHFTALQLHPEHQRHIDLLIQWLAPTHSGIKHHDQVKKIYDLREMVESTTGVPHIINTTWHKLYEDALQGKWKRNARYWADHFNYMDASMWHEILEERSKHKRRKLEEALEAQIGHKLGALSLIGRQRAQEAREVLLEEARPVRTAHLYQAGVASQLNPLARFWVMYARLSATVQELEASAIRLGYPARGIGKLKAAQVELLHIQPPSAGDEKDKGHVLFALAGMSSNAKFKEGDHALLMPERARSRLNASAWKVELQSVCFDSVHKRYIVKATPSGWESEGAPALLLREREQGHGDEPVYLYPEASDAWSGKLLDHKESLLKRHDGRMGLSWLGERAAYLWRLGMSARGLRPAPKSAFAVDELMMYAPGLLPAGAPVADALRTTAYPKPDPSQEEAIRLAMGRVVTCLQGPPGTGKSQTITALIDEFICRYQGPKPPRILVTSFSYDAMSVIADKLRRHRAYDGQPTRAAQAQLVFCRSSSRDEVVLQDEPGVAHIFDLELSSDKMILDGETLSRGHSRKSLRLEDHLEGRAGGQAKPLVLFANAHQLYHFSKDNPGDHRYFVRGDFAFDLIIVDEASQLPTDQLLSALTLVKPGLIDVVWRAGEPTDWANAPLELVEQLALAPGAPDGASSAWTKLVVVGDQHQLPPVQPVKPPRNLQNVVGSLFNYLVEGHKLPFHQLRRNYRSNETIVDYTRSLGLYEDLEAFWATQPARPLGTVPDDALPWVKHVLDPAVEVHTLIHERTDETAISPLEAKIVAELCLTFRRQLGVVTPEQEARFWAEELGVVAPHNAQGRLIARLIKEQLSGHTQVSDDVLDRMLGQTIYSVEKFQGSDRACIIASMGISSVDQLRAEEEFIYGLNRFNVLTSRAKQKMILVTSRNFLEYIPQDRDIMRHAARIRAYALSFCDQQTSDMITNERGEPERITRRWRDL